ncbi:MAG: Holliday junction branch migration protein RuvA [Candidatus Paceibacterota bacterium]|jgi:Holliday junction DNA helicase RuvA
MLYSLKGTITEKKENSFVIECGGIGMKALTHSRALSQLPPVGEEVRVFCRLYIRDEQMELFAFVNEEELTFFEMLNTVGGVGPKTALGVLEIDKVPNIMAAILEKRIDVLTHASGIGKKTAERIVLELQNKIKLSGSHATTKEMDMNREIEEILVGLGYVRHAVRVVLQKGEKKETLEERLRDALRELGRTA